MTRKLIVALVATVIGIGVSAQAMAGDWHHRKHGHFGQHHGWHQGKHNGWRDRNHDGVINWRDHGRRRDHGHWRGSNDVRDFNHDGRIDKDDRRIRNYLPH